MRETLGKGSVLDTKLKKVLERGGSDQWCASFQWLK